MIYWFTGQPGHGKSVQAKLLLQYLEINDSFCKSTFHIDGDHLREIVKNADYSKEGRVRNIQLAQTLAKYLHLNGYDVVISLVAPFRDVREEFKQEMGSDLIEIYVDTDEIRGREHFHVDYEEPLNNFIYLSTSNEMPEQTNIKLLQLLDLGYVE